MRPASPLFRLPLRGPAQASCAGRARSGAWWGSEQATGLFASRETGRCGAHRRLSLMFDGKVREIK